MFLRDMGKGKAKKDRVTRHDLRHDGGKGKTLLRTRTKRNSQLALLFASIPILEKQDGDYWTNTTIIADKKETQVDTT